MRRQETAASLYPADHGSATTRQGKPPSNGISITDGPLKFESDPCIGLSLSVPQKDRPVSQANKRHIAVSIIIEVSDRHSSS